MLDVIMALFQWACLVATPNEARDKREALTLTERQRRRRRIARKVFVWVTAIPVALFFLALITSWI